MHVFQDDDIIVLKQEQEDEGLYLVRVLSDLVAGTHRQYRSGLLRGRRGLFPGSRRPLPLKTEEIYNDETLLRFREITHTR